jgi:hypothetical protein
MYVEIIGYSVLLRVPELALERAREVMQFLVTAGKPPKDSKPEAVQTKV